MGRRVAIPEPEAVSPGGAYFEDEEATLDLPTFKSGGTLIDLMNGGGWVLGGTVNVVGDKSTGKTQLAIEAGANFAAQFPEAPIRYVDAENAFDEPYAALLGFPKHVHPISDIETTEAFAKDVSAFLETVPEGGPALYILDSLDSLSDDAELDREIGDATYGTAKAKQMSEFFRTMKHELRRKRVCLFVISQIRSAVGTSYGKSWTRAGGRALDFYALQVVYLTHLKRLEAQRLGVKRAYGIVVKAKNEKNKVGLPFRDCEYEVHFNFGIEDAVSMLNWLIETKGAKEALGSEAEAKRVLDAIPTMDTETYAALRKKLRRAVKARWEAVDEALKPLRKKVHG